MPLKVCITGLGIISAIGDDTQQNLRSLLAEKPQLRFPLHLDSVYKDIFPTGEIAYSNQELIQKVGLEPTSTHHRTALLGIIATQEAVEQAALTPNQIANLSFFNATTVGGMCATENNYVAITDRSNHSFLDPQSYLLDCADTTEKVADSLSIKNHLTSMSTACSSAANAIILAARHIRAKKTNIALCGGVDALSKFTLNGFNSLKNISNLPNAPFDANRTGLNLGEAGAYIVLESEESAKARGVKIFATLSGWANVSEAFHQTSPSPEGTGAYLSMKKALDTAQLHATDIDYINTHGTATQSNDLSEGMAIEKLFGKNPPPFSSTKPYTGHTLAAAGGVEAIFSILAINHQILYPNFNFEQKMPELNILPQTRLETECRVKHVLSNSFGFGGSNSTLVFSEYA